MLYFISFGIIEPILFFFVFFENRIPLKSVLGGGGAYAALQTTVLHMKRLNKTESPIFVILFVFFFCFHRQSFFTFILPF